MMRTHLAVVCVCFLRIILAQDIPLGCGGFLKSNFDVDFTRVKVKLYSSSGSLKYTTDCAPNNGYFLVPLYDRGEFQLRIDAPLGWIIEPEEVTLKVDGETDKCSRAEDINFEMIGFSVFGQVVSLGGGDGPRGVSVKLLDDKTVVGEVVTTDEGRFSLGRVTPGSYQLVASHSVWDIVKDPVPVVVTGDSVEVPPSLVVNGYDVRGGVESGGEAMDGVKLMLFSSQDIKVQCGAVSSVDVPKHVSTRNGRPALCVTSSDKKGLFVFPSLPPGNYDLVPYYRQEMIEFEVQPVAISFVVHNDTVHIEPHFEVQGFSVAGQVLIVKQGAGVANAKVYVDGDLVTTTDESGQYRLMNVTTGTYKIKVEAADLLFSPVDVSVSPSNPTLPTILPSKYPVCGDVTLTLPPTESVTASSREIRVLSSPSRKQLASSRTDNAGRFCVMLPLGQYVIKVFVSEAEEEQGLVVLPKEQMVAMLETPTTTKLHFTQFLASLSGKVKCLGTCPEATVSVQRNGKRAKGGQSLTTKVVSKGRKGEFTFADVLPGQVKVTLDYPQWCWREESIIMEVTTGKLTPPTFTHEGYRLSYSVPQDTLVSYTVGNESAVDVVFSGSGHICVSKPGQYTIVPKSCHKFEKEKYSYSTSSPEVLMMKAVGHSVTTSILSTKKDKNISLLVRSLRFGVSEQTITSSAISPIQGDNTWKYSFSFIAKSGDEIEVIPQCSDLMFTPQTRKKTVSDECPEEISSFEGNPGLIVTGQIQPKLEGVTILIKVEGDSAVTRTTTDKNGKYRSGPYQTGQSISVSAELDGYVFEALPDNQYSFKALKLSKITIKVVGSDGVSLSGVLVSLSGANFRSNNFTSDNGEALEYRQLNPGQYYIKPLLREYDFSPSSKVVDLSQGQSEEVVFLGSRVAFSCYGKVTTLNRLPVSGLTVQAIGEGVSCGSYNEESTSDDDGNYRIRGLMPKCMYTLEVQTGSISDITSALPSSKTIQLAGEDVKDVNFVVLYESSNIFITGNVVTEEWLLKSLKAQLLCDGKLIHSASLDSAGFFDFSPVSVDSKKQYQVVLEPNLSPHLFTFSQAEQLVHGDRDTHVTLEFSATEIQSEQESQRGSVLALVIAIVVVFVCINAEKIYSWIQNGGGRLDTPISSSNEPLGRKKTNRRK